MLIKLHDNLFVNGESIDAVEIRNIKDKRLLIVWVRGKMFEARVTPEELLLQLNAIGAGSQHFAG